jgi:hypothetical protein
MYFYQTASIVLCKGCMMLYGSHSRYKKLDCIIAAGIRGPSRKTRIVYIRSCKR